MTNIRRFLKQIRLDHGEVVKDMAEHLGVSISFICAVERGTRKMPKTVRDKIINEYNLSNEQTLLFDKPILKDSDPVKINVKSLSEIKRNLVLELADKIIELSDQHAELILAYITSNLSKDSLY